MICFVISLKTATEFSRLPIVRHLSSQGFSVRRIKAVNGKKIAAGDYFRLSSLSKVSSGHFLSPSELGCALSHQAALDHLVAEQLPFASIFEDDAIPKTELASVLQSLSKQNLRGRFVHLGGLDGLSVQRNIYVKRTASTTFEIHDWSLPYLWRSCGYIVGYNAARQILEKYKLTMFRADDFNKIGAALSGRIEMSVCIAHPISLINSSIEGERQLALRHTQPFFRKLFRSLRYQTKTLLYTSIVYFVGFRPLTYECARYR